MWKRLAIAVSLATATKDVGKVKAVYRVATPPCGHFLAHSRNVTHCALRKSLISSAGQGNSALTQRNWGFTWN